MKHNYTTTIISPALIAIIVVLGSALLVVSYYKIFAKVLQRFSMEILFQEDT